jgi:hypothetical protein
MFLIFYTVQLSFFENFYKLSDVPLETFAHLSAKYAQKEWRYEKCL